LPTTLGDWLRAASADPHVYAEAGCQVSRWAETNGGKEAVLTPAIQLFVTDPGEDQEKVHLTCQDLSV